MKIRFPEKLHKKLQTRVKNNALRSLAINNTSKVDFYSNDYLGFAKNESIKALADKILSQEQFTLGATGSRLLSGNAPLYHHVEDQIADFHNQSKALLFNSGYNANIGFFSAVPQRGDIVLYDEYIHASIRDGLQMSLAKSYKFSHNNLKDIKEKVKRYQENHQGEIYVVTESVFSMDGDSPDLVSYANFCSENGVYLVIDEAHSLGVFGTNGEGLVSSLGLQNKVFAQIVTFGKGLGCHGAAILGSNDLYTYLVNFARSLIYTTAIPPHAVASISAGYQLLKRQSSFYSNQLELLQNIDFFKKKLSRLRLDQKFIKSDSAIHCCIVSGNEKVKEVAFKIQDSGFEVKPIMSPTVPLGQERLRFCLHSYNTKEEIEQVLGLVAKLI